MPIVTEPTKRQELEARINAAWVALRNARMDKDTLIIALAEDALNDLLDHYKT